MTPKRYLPERDLCLCAGLGRRRESDSRQDCPLQDTCDRVHPAEEPLFQDLRPDKPNCRGSADPISERHACDARKHATRGLQTRLTSARRLAVRQPARGHSRRLSRAPRAGCMVKAGVQLGKSSMLAQYIAQRQLVRAHLRNRMSGSVAITAAAQQPRAQPHGRTGHEPAVGLSRSPRATVATHAGRTATLDRHVSIETWEEELVGRQPSVSFRRAAGSSSITPWRRSSAGESCFPRLLSPSQVGTLTSPRGRVRTGPPRCIHA